MTDSAQLLGADGLPATGSELTIKRHARGMLRGGLWPSVVSTVIAVVLGGVFAGVPGVIGAAFGAVIVVACCWLNIAILGWTAPSHPMIAMAGMTAGFVGKIAVLMVLLILLRGTTLFDTNAFGYTILATVVVWTVGEIVGFARTRVTTVAPNDVEPR